MLNHSVIGPGADGQYRVVYTTPGCTVPTVVTPCSTEESARTEADRLNEQQKRRQKVVDEELRLCGLSGVRRA